MKKRLFNIHKLIGINVILFFFVSLFFGIITIFQPYINIWEDSKQHIKQVKIEDINLDKCVKQVTKRTYFDENGKKLRKDLIKLNFPSKEVRGTNLIQIKNRPSFYLSPQTCKRVRPKNFTISMFFDKIHTGAIFNSFIWKILFGFMSIAVVFLSLSGVYLIIKNSYRNSKTKTLKGFYAKYHRLLFLYTLPLVFMFGLSGALFNLGVYSSPLITNYLTDGKTSNILSLERNILQDPDLKSEEKSENIKTINLNKLYKKAKNEFDDISFYAMQIYNYNDINAKVKFIGYEPRNFFISSMGNETYVVLNGVTGEVLNKKTANQGSFTEKTLDAIFYLHYLKTFNDIPRITFGILCILILFGLLYAMALWFERAKQDKFMFKIIKPLTFTIFLGSLISTSLLFASTWLIEKKYLYFNMMEKLYNTQEVLFYLVFLLIFILILIKKDLFKVTKYVFFITSILLLVAVISHNTMSKYNLWTLLDNGFMEIFYTDIVLLIISIIFFIISIKLPEKYFIFDKKIT